ncbi:hypothetical protein FEM48_ZijujUnG0086700 [Ziziphus jujuba var. spinosa]|uniref:Uncharacterized protein n=1 Tax=Ziziphus jujuba var. spinosa TaxID=714518 RepID=A0A978U8L1_ZIZJJ|nr:hypothetical protein FEM48_ZijujUnG0086700 [Ziziphus jujuba var. spinosa]
MVNTSSQKDGHEYGVWLRDEEGAFSVIREGMYLRRIENPLRDYFDSFSNEELRDGEKNQTSEQDYPSTIVHDRSADQSTGEEEALAMATRDQSVVSHFSQGAEHCSEKGNQEDRDFEKVLEGGKEGIEVNRWKEKQMIPDIKVMLFRLKVLIGKGAEVKRGAQVSSTHEETMLGANSKEDCTAQRITDQNTLKGGEFLDLENLAQPRGETSDTVNLVNSPRRFSPASPKMRLKKRARGITQWEYFGAEHLGECHWYRGDR